MRFGQPAQGGDRIFASPLARRIDEFLASRGYTAPAVTRRDAPPVAVDDRSVMAPPTSPSPAPPKNEAAPDPTVQKAADFVCEDDVRLALRQGRKIVIAERTIITPAARDLGEENRVFVQASWPR